MLRSVRLRLTLWYIVLLAIILAGFSAGIYLLLRHTLYDNLDDSINNRANTFLGIVQYDADRPSLGDITPPTGPDADESFARIFDARGNVTSDYGASGGDSSIDSQAVERALSGETSTRSLTVGDEQMRVRTLPIRRDDEIAGVLEVGQAADDPSETLRALLVILGAGFPVTLAVASLGGLFLAGRALSPIDSLTRLARRISAEDLSQRLHLDLPDDEVGRLARTFDDMIARLDAAFRRQRQFTADASHELRTPLTAIKGQVEVALQRDRGVDAYKEVLRNVNSETDRMIRLVGNLLTLARADAREIPIEREGVDLAQVVADAVEHTRPEAERRGVPVTVRTEGRARVFADQDLLLQLALNLLDNALKYTPGNHGSVEVALRRNGAYVEMIVTDTGKGILSEDLPRIFERFYRVDKARSRAEGGAGLGLSICLWIAEVHGGSIEADSEPGRGSKFTVRIPAA